jgi:hypothetical protein
MIATAETWVELLSNWGEGLWWLALVALFVILVVKG